MSVLEDNSLVLRRDGDGIVDGDGDRDGIRDAGFVRNWSQLSPSTTWVSLGSRKLPSVSTVCGQAGAPLPALSLLSE